MTTRRIYFCVKKKILELGIGYIVSALIGVALGLTGGGGSIITVPMLVYFFHVQPVTATTYSLFIVSGTSLVGGIRNALRRQVDFPKAILISIPAMLTIFFTRHYILPLIPESLDAIHGVEITRDTAVMVIFVIVMFIIAARMISSASRATDMAVAPAHLHVRAIVTGVVVGFLSGIIGAGGGFLIIPALVEFEKLSIKRAVGTSLIIIAANSLAGFLGDTQSIKTINMGFLMTLSLLSIGGVLLGGYLAKFIAGEKLKSAFGWFTLLVAFFVLYEEVFVKVLFP